MEYALFRFGQQWVLHDGNGEVLCRRFKFDVISVLWRAHQRNHISNINICWRDDRGIEQKAELFDKRADLSDIDESDMSFTFRSSKDRITLAGFLWVLSDPAYRFNFEPVVLPKSKRPTSKKAVANDWEYTTPTAVAG